MIILNPMIVMMKIMLKVIMLFNDYVIYMFMHRKKLSFVVYFK